MRLVQKTIIIVALLSLIGCAGMSKNDCMTKDWHQAGYADGSQGKFKNNLANETQACAKYDIAVDGNAYGQGWEQGVRSFCQPSRAMQMGINGQKYNPVCPTDLATAFEGQWRQGLRQYCVPKKGYQLGRSGGTLPDFCAPDQANAFTVAFQEGYRIHQQVSDLQSQLSGLDKQISDNEKEISDSQRRVDRWVSKLSDPVVVADPVAVESLRVKIKENNKNIQRANQRISSLRFQRSTVQAKLNKISATA